MKKQFIVKYSSLLFIFSSILFIDAYAQDSPVFRGVNITVLENTQKGFLFKFTVDSLQNDGANYYRFDLVPNYGKGEYDPFNNYIIMQDFSESPYCTYEISAPAAYIFTFYVSSTQGFESPLSPIIGGSVIIDDQMNVSTTNFSIGIDEPVKVGDEVIFSVSSVSYEVSETLYYRFDLIPNYGKFESYDPWNGYITLQDWSTSNVCTHVFNNANDYIIIAYISDSYGFQSDITPIIGCSVHVSSEQLDLDGDGYSESQSDCNDNDASVFPGAVEICQDGIDQDCDGSDLICPVDPNESDDDDDGFSEAQGDCMDYDPAVFPGAEEICEDGIDQNCDGIDAQCEEGPELPTPTL